MKVLNDILGYNLKIYQESDWFCFSIDSIILANFSKIKKRTRRILDLGCGNGIIPLILSRRTNCLIEGVEIQKDLAQLAKESVLANGLDEQITIYNMDMKELLKDLSKYNTYDMIVSNPPYFKSNSNGVFNDDIHKIIARHEVMITLEEVVNIAFQLLKEGACFATVNRVERFIEIIDIFKKYKLEVKYVRFIYDNLETQPCLFYIEGVKCGKSGCVIDKPFIMYDNNHIETDEYKKLKKEVMQ